MPIFHQPNHTSNAVQNSSQILIQLSSIDFSLITSMTAIRVFFIPATSPYPTQFIVVISCNYTHTRHPECSRCTNSVPRSRATGTVCDQQIQNNHPRKNQSRFFFFARSREGQNEMSNVLTSTSSPISTLLIWLSIPNFAPLLPHTATTVRPTCEIT